MENQTTVPEKENMTTLEGGQVATTDAQQSNQQTPPPVNDQPSKGKVLLGKVWNGIKKGAPYVGAAVAGAAVTAGAIVVALCKGESNDDVPALEKDENLEPVDEFIGEAEFIDDTAE